MPRLDVDSPHVVVPLLGRFKGETGERSHLLVMTDRTVSGIAIRGLGGKDGGLVSEQGIDGCGTGYL